MTDPKGSLFGLYSECVREGSRGGGADCADLDLGGDPVLVHVAFDVEGDVPWEFGQWLFGAAEPDGALLAVALLEGEREVLFLHDARFLAEADVAGHEKRL